ncbi:hypothetical protein [Hydrogenimonas cancrithermarum]|uniref:Uncharacterized protein n=1 Tax=Hydrogenimonas cancrithermarum TaxID=2993563 RepID=A0ABM8FM99_9BACT|nr:hypothetical protein [Hydrogenimonas cancrithermarum]BDY12845.1 hypothetical protein HCR_11570 [Hydrogenimonas cancrithermarum]BDY12962.1 hypothetical protein HCR_12740 [Hydrogenimonas cancrithermarum]
MKRIFLTLILSLLPLMAGNDALCIETSQKLFDLQNAIVTDAFEKLEPGAWAEYRAGDRSVKAVYAGRARIGNSTLQGIEFGNAPVVEQVWYAIVDKRFTIGGETYTMRTLDPRLLFVRTKNGLFRLDYSQLSILETFMGRRSLSTILTPAQIHVPPDCSHIPRLSSRSVRLKSGKRIEATAITSETGETILVSERVPFGVVRLPGRPGAELIDFGFEGGETTIDAKARKRAKTFALPRGPAAFPIAPFGGVPR